MDLGSDETPDVGESNYIGGRAWNGVVLGDRASDVNRASSIAP